MTRNAFTLAAAMLVLAAQPAPAADQRVLDTFKLENGKIVERWVA